MLKIGLIFEFYLQSRRHIRNTDTQLCTEISQSLISVYQYLTSKVSITIIINII